MDTLKIVVIVIHVLIAFGLMAAVLFQSGKSQGLSGSIAGGAETFFGKNKGKTMDGVLAKATVILAILFVITSVSLSLISKEIAEAEKAVKEGQTTQEETVVDNSEVSEGLDLVTEDTTEEVADETNEG